MPIIDKLAPTSPDVATTSVAGNPEAWLKQLESAQWQQRLRYQPSGQHVATRHQFSDSQTPHFEARQNQKSWQTAENPEPTHPVQKQVRQSAQESRSLRIQNGISHKDIAQPIMAGTSARSETKMIAPDENEIDMRQLHRFFKNDYKRSNAHVMLQAEEVKLWLRDARIQIGEGPKLLRSLRQHFARMGLRLAQLTLNGTNISENEYSE